MAYYRINCVGKSHAWFLAELNAIPESKTSLILRSNDLGQKSGAELEQALRAIPTSVTSLNLAWNVLGEKSGAELKQALRAIPTSVTSLNLTVNELGAKLSLCISDKVQEIMVSENDINSLSNTELIKLRKALSWVRKVNVLDNNDRIVENEKTRLLKPYIGASIREANTQLAKKLPVELISLIQMHANGISPKDREEFVSETVIPKTNRNNFFSQKICGISAGAVLGAGIAAAASAIVAYSYRG